MSVEDEIILGRKRLEAEILMIDNEMERLHTKLLHMIKVRNKKEHDLRILRMDSDIEDIQINLTKVLKEKI